MKIWIGLLCFIVGLPMAFALRTVQKNVVLDHFEDYDRCAPSGYPANLCDIALHRWVGKHPEDAWDAAGKILPKNQDFAISFYSTGLRGNPSRCSDLKIHSLVLSALKENLNSEAFQAAQEIAFTDCFSLFSKDLSKEAQADPVFLHNNCLKLKEKNLIGLRLFKKCSR